MYLMWTKRNFIAAAAALSIAASGSSAVAAGVEADLPIPASLFASATVDGCENNPGPTITLSGELTLGELNVRLIFRNNQRGTHERTEDVTIDLTLLPAARRSSSPSSRLWVASAAIPGSRSSSSMGRGMRSPIRSCSAAACRACPRRCSTSIISRTRASR